MTKSPLESLSVLDRYRRAMGGAVVALLLANGLVALTHSEDKAGRISLSNQDSGASASNDGASNDSNGTSVLGTNQAAASPVGGKLPPGSINSNPATAGKYIPGIGTIPLGINDKKIRIVYYWKGDQVMGGSAYLHGTGQEGNVDEGEAFRALVDYINKHNSGDQTFMGSTFNLHGRTIEPIVLETGKDAQITAAAEDIVKKWKPFAAISSHGSLSAYVCPILAKAKIFNFGTYDLGGKSGTLAERTNGYCVPQATSWETQVDHVVPYLSKQQKATKYVNEAGLPVDRVYGFVYAQYPGLVDVVDRTVRRLRAAGINIPDDAVMGLDAGLSNATTQAPNYIAQLKYLGVNTLIIPDAGAPLSFTHASETNAYFPDWFVWPCSGQDSTGMVRLYDAHQWTRAAGLTCYDPEFNADLVNDRMSRTTEWYQAYQEVRPGDEPPAPTSLVYQSFLPLLVGLTNAGRDVTVEKFRAGMRAFTPYRYSAVQGKTSNGLYMMVGVGRQDLVMDVAKIDWDPNAPADGGLQGRYVYPETRRYDSGATY